MSNDPNGFRAFFDQEWASIHLFLSSQSPNDPRAQVLQTLLGLFSRVIPSPSQLLGQTDSEAREALLSISSLLSRLANFEPVLSNTINQHDPSLD